LPPKAQDTSAATDSAADSSSIVTLKDGTTYSKDTLAMVYLYRLYARKPPKTGMRTSFTGELSSAARDTTASKPKKWKKWKKDEVADIAGTADLQIREDRAVAYLEKAAREGASRRKRTGGIMLAGSLAMAGVGLILYDLDKQQAQESEGTWVEYESGSLLTFMWPSGMFFVLSVIQFNLKGGEEKAYQSYLKEKDLKPAVQFYTTPDDRGGAEFGLYVTVPFN
ncbi:MAG: hypothetical protein JSW34_13490, partial [Candidatus Zixiibacteriota bacterium]